MINEAVAGMSFFGVFLTAAVYVFALWLQKKTRLAILNPLLVTCSRGDRDIARDGD